ncbi:MAG TPA: hypothetical protein VK824_03165, partial [Planctomycetota bacterium]|nr:hypothetical protein [Planctomycetota bacterium]
MSGRDSIEPERVSGVRLAILLLVALAGAAGWLAFAGAAGLAHPAQGAFWSVRDADDRVLPLAADGAGLPLHPGQIFWLDAGEGAARRYTGLSLRLAPGGGQSAYADLRFGEAGASNFRFVFVPSQPPTAYLGSREGEGPWVELAHAQLAGPSADPRAPCDLGLRLLPDAIETTWNGRPLLRAPTPAPPLASRVALWTDDARLLSVRAEGEESDGPFDASSDGARDGSRAVTRDDPSDGQRDTRRDGQSARRAAAIRSFARTEDFTTLAGDALRRQRGLAGLALAGAVALAALYLRSRCTRAPPPARLALATLLLLAPAGLPFAVHALAPLPGLDPRAAAAFLALPGLLLALRSLRAFVRVDVPRAGLDIPRAGLDVPRAGLADRGRGALVVLALLGATAFAASGAAGARADRALREAQAWLPRLDATPYALDAPRTLDAGNALAIPGVRRDLDLAARVTLSGDGLLEVRLRSADDQPVAGLALCLRAGDAAQSGFFVENSFEFRRAGNARVAAPADVPFELELRLRGDRAEAAIDGVPVADATCDEFPAGGSFVLAAAGSARVERLELRPVAGGGAVPRPERARALAALGAVVLLALLAAAARVLFRQSWPEALPT